MRISFAIPLVCEQGNDKTRNSRIWQWDRQWIQCVHAVHTYKSHGPIDPWLITVIYKDAQQALLLKSSAAVNTSREIAINVMYVPLRL